MSIVFETQIREELEMLLQRIGLTAESNLIALHLTEIEEEADAILDRLTLFRAHARNNEAELAQESLVELAMTLSHLQNHVQTILPDLERVLDLED